MIGDDNQEQIEYQNRCARHAEFYDGCGPCIGNATEEFLLERSYQQTHVKESERLKELSDKATKLVDRLTADHMLKGIAAVEKSDHDFKEGDKVIFSGVKNHNIIDEQPTREFVVGPPMSVQEFADVMKQGIEHAKKLNEGVKFDDDKPRYDLIPAKPLEELAKVYTVGAKKYADRNWEKGMRWGRVFAAMMRHAWAWWMGETNDKESGVHHMAAVAWGAFALIEYSQTKTGQDDRPIGVMQPPEQAQKSPYTVSIFDSIGVMVTHNTFVDYDEARDFVTREILNYHGGHAHIKNRQGTVMWEGVHD